MTNATPALLALLLVCSLPAMSLVAADPGGPDESIQDTSVQQTPIEVDETTNRLPIGESRTAYTETTPNLGSLFASGDDELRVDHEQYVIAEREFDDASDAEREEMIETAHAQLRDRIEALEEREREIVQGHANGDRSDGELVQMVLRNYNEAIALENALETLDDRSNQVPDYSLPRGQELADGMALDFHTTSLRTNLAAASESPQTQQQYDLRIQTSQDGYRISTVDGSAYVTETVRFDNRNPSAEDQFADTEEQEYPALNYASELYPWADEHGSDHYITSDGIYEVRFAHDQGDLELYLDGGSGEVHREIQSISIGSLPTTTSDSWSDGDLEMMLNETPANGPVEVTVTDSADGVESATISIDDHEVGTTDEDGTVWILPPDRSYEVTAETDDGTVTGTVSGG
ncbi:hypothetical protein ACLI4Z_01840 [Natrialbaceae archaeon A-arb3/5]